LDAGDRAIGQSPLQHPEQPWHVIAILPKDEAQSFFAKDFAKHDESSVKSQNMGIRTKTNQTLHYNTLQ